jgi:glycerophosphoryl diester phosphodiesterase
MICKHHHYILRNMRWLILPFLLCCAMTAKETIEVHGHRGARSVLPENTLPGFMHAIESGADWVELDLAVTKDDVVVVSHDPHINPAICSGPQERPLIRDLTLAEVKQYDCGAKANPGFPRQKAVPGTRIPTLDEALALAPKGKFGFNIEIKIRPSQPDWTVTPARFAELVLAAIRKHRLESRVLVQSFDFRALHEMKKLGPDISLAALYEGPAKSLLEIAREAGAGTVAPQFRLVTEQQVKAAHAAGLKVVPWTANEPAEWERLIKAGVDAIITDDPAGLIAYLRERR